MASVVLPKVRMFIPCLSVTLEAGKPVTIHSPLHTIRMPLGVTEKYLLDELFFYVVLTDAVGAFRLTVEMRSVDDIVLQRSESEQVKFVGGAKLKVKELGIRMISVPFGRPGLFEFRLFANHAHLEEGGTAMLRVLPG
ncbi:MAG TPA: hypothetical protein VFE62_26150 [Gemmataceae bacterium]|nr:hypothetical protein [Gemmataceae bacterium]